MCNRRRGPMKLSSLGIDFGPFLLLGLLRERRADSHGVGVGVGGVGVGVGGGRARRWRVAFCCFPQKG